MALQLYSTAVTGEFERLLPGIQEVAEWSLWVRTVTRPFAGRDLAEFSRAFGELRGVIWHASSGRAMTPRMRDYQRAFGYWPKLNENLAMRNTIEYTDGDRKVYSDVAWVSPDAYGSVASILSESTGGMDSAFSFIPGDEKSGQAWANIVSGLNWLWLCRGWYVFPSQRLAIDIEMTKAVVLSYVRLTVELNGAAGLVWEDPDARRGLVFFGRQSLLQSVASVLMTRFEFLDEVSFTRWWFERGAVLPIYT